MTPAWLYIYTYIYHLHTISTWTVSLVGFVAYFPYCTEIVTGCHSTTAGNFHMTLLQLYNHTASPLLSLPPCKNSHIRRRPLSCLFSILPTISLYSNGARTLDERWSLARLLLSRWGSSAIDRWLPSGWEVGGRESGRGWSAVQWLERHFDLEDWRQAPPLTKTLWAGWRTSRQVLVSRESLKTLAVLTAAVVRKGPRENSLWQGGRD